MNVSISYAAPDVATLCEAIQSVRALGVAPAVTIAPASPARRGAPEPEVEKYLAERGETIFRLTKAEKQAGLSRDAAARARMETDGWQAVIAAAPQDAEPEPWEGGETF